MAAKNDITGDSIQTKLATDAYRNNFDSIFGKKKKEEKKTTRHFAHVIGFDDGTKYLTVTPDGRITLTDENDNKTTYEGGYTLETCLKWVDEGVWKEVFPE